MSDPDDPDDPDDIDGIDGIDETGDVTGPADLSVRERRRAALGQDALLFCTAFTLGSLAFGTVAAIASVLGTGGDFWSIGLSDDLVFSGLVAGELFLLWNNGYRQGVRGHSMGKHRWGIAVVDRTTRAPAGAVRGFVRGLVVAVLLDLSIAALPLGLPTVLRRVTPEAWHVGGATYVALLLLLVPVVLSLDRRVADRISGTEVVRFDSQTSPRRSQMVMVLGLVGVMGVLGLAVAYIAYFSPLLRFPALL